jgi:hypothetical protein
MNQNLGVADDSFRQLFEPVGESGYKDVSGSWLAKPSETLMGAFHVQPSLSFIQNKELLSLLHSAAGISSDHTDDAHKSCHVELITNVQISNLRRSKKSSSSGGHSQVMTSVYFVRVAHCSRSLLLVFCTSGSYFRLISYSL